MRILVIEDDVRLRELLREGFADRDIEVAVAGTAREGREKAALAHWDVIVLDIGLPDADGFETCARLRRSGVETPILMLTARDAVADRVHGLETGADDYLVKPFDFRELAARVASLARRPPVIAPESVTVADLEVDLRTHAVQRAGQSISLTAKEFSLLEFFAHNVGAVVDRAAITAYVWDDNHDPFTNALEVLVRRLRAKIDDPFDKKLIQTVRGAGYRFGP